VDDLLDDLVEVNATLTAAQNEMNQTIDEMQGSLVNLQDQIDTLEDANQDVTDQADETDSFAAC